MLLFYAQTEIEHRAGEVPGSLQHTSAQPACQFPSANVQSNSCSFGNVTDSLNSHTALTGQTQTAGMLNAPPNPLRQNLHSNHHPIHCSAYGTINSLPDGIGAQSNHPPQHQNFMHCNSYEPSMDESWCLLRMWAIWKPTACLLSSPGAFKIWYHLNCWRSPIDCR